MVFKNARFPFATIFAKLWLDLAALIRFAISGNFNDSKAISKAHIDFFRNYQKMLDKRKAMQASYSVSKIYKKSIVWDYFIRSKKYFSDLNPTKFT